MASPCTVLITCIGGVYSRDTIEALRRDVDLSLRIIGCDAHPEPVNRHFVDVFRQVPSASESRQAFAEVLGQLCRDLAVHVVIPGADEEVLALAEHKAMFDAMGVTCCVETVDKLSVLRDKALLFDFLSQAGIAVPAYRRVDHAADVAAVATALGYPERPFVLKPRTGRGARGLILVDATVPVATDPAGARGYVRGDVRAITARLEAAPPVPLLAMAYLPGPAYDVDCVAVAGQPQCVVVRRRLWSDPLSPVSQGCRVERHEALESQTRQIVQALGWSFACDLDFGTGPDGTVGLFEVNPRWSGATASALVAGVNIPSLLVRTATHMAIPQVEVEPGGEMFPVTRMVFVRTGRSPVTGAEQL